MIYLASDHGGFKLKTTIARWLTEQGYPVTDLGPAHLDVSDDYPVWAATLARHVQRQRNSRGIAVCRSGIGMAIVANKFSGVRAAQAFSSLMAKKSRLDENANVLSLAADYHDWPELRAILRAWLTTKYRPTKRFNRRLREIGRLEHGH